MFNTKFFAQDELDKLYKHMKQKPYKQKEDWEKFLNDSSSVHKQKEKIRKEKETSIEYYKL